MTWSLSNTVTYSSGADSHAALVYLFDTALSGLSQWTVSAHPDASSYKRKAKRTSTTLFGGGSYEEHFWINWSSETAPTTMSWYEDATYTSSPGDLCTDTTNVSSSSLTSGGIDSLDWKFWTSDQNSKALLVTRGKSIVFWEPGFSAAALMEDPDWTGASDSRRTQIFPGLRSLYTYMTGWPSTNSNTTTAEYCWFPSLGNYGGTGYWDGERIDLNVPFMATATTNAVPSQGAGFLFAGLGNDVGCYRPATTSNAYIQMSNTGNQGQLMLANSNYYLLSYDSVSYAQMAFNFGTSEPTF